MKTKILLLFGLAMLPVYAQQRGPAPVVSPEVQADRKVTFRMRAPNAAQVSLLTDWAPAGQAMTKDAEGVWSITVGPLEPTTYIYSFTVDGVAMADPSNSKIKLRARGAGSLVDVPGPAPALWDPQNGPHGAVQVNWHKSKVLNGETRQVWVYTPPGYDKDRKKYPVLYLLHGNNDTAAGWTTAGNANFILDNLLVEKKIQPMIVVMPFGHALPIGTQGNNIELFEKYLMGDVIPYVESEYRVAPGTKNRAIAGLSMGGGQSLAIGLTHIDSFSSIGVFSSGGPNDFETRYAGVLKDAKGTNAKLKPFYIACGRQDPAFARAENVVKALEKSGVKHIFRATDGVHNFAIWRQHLAELLPMLFR